MRGHLDNIHGYELKVSGKSGALVVLSIGQTTRLIRQIDYEAESS
jgi:hypothetical protein